MSLIAFQTCESLSVTIIFFLSAQLLSIMATNSQSRRGTSCIKCNVFQPHGGKLLSCMHLICAGCCRDEIAQGSNTIKCVSCSAITKAVVSGVGIVDQLMSSEPYLYKASDAAPTSDPAGNQAEESKLCCEFCEEHDTSAVTHECEKALREVEKQVQSLVLVEEVPPIDVTKVIVTLPNNVHPDEQSTVSLTFPGVTTTEPPVLTAKISPPSGGSYDAGICNSSASSITELVMSASFTTREVGWHSLEVSDSAGRTKPIPFECRLPGPLALDQQKCSRRITISDSNHVATHTGTGRGWASVAANDGYTTGRHTWKVKIHKTQRNAGYMYFGVCPLPDDGNYDGTYYFFNSETNYSWQGDGYSVANGECSDVDCSEFKDGDTATLTLDCEQKTLQIHHQRTDERRTISNVNCDKPLYPAICMHKPGLRAEIQ